MVGATSCQEIVPARLNHIPLNATAGACPTSQQVQTAVAQIKTGIEDILSTCGGPTWRNVAMLNMMDPAQSCPSVLAQISAPIRACQCTAPHVNTVSCSEPITFTVGSSYSKVCGKITAYQYREPISFYAYHNYNQQDLNSVYVSGLSLTHGLADNREHIWTFAGASNQVDQTQFQCPLSAAQTPPFVGNDYFCDSGNPSGAPAAQYYLDDPLWDGQGCDADPDLRCLNNNPPWFSKMLPKPTTDDIDLRVCGDQRVSVANFGIEQIVLYVQ